MSQKQYVNPQIESLIQRGDQAGNFTLQGKNEADFEHSFWQAFEQSKQQARLSKENSNANQSHLQCRTKQTVLSN